MRVFSCLNYQDIILDEGSAFRIFFASKCSIYHTLSHSQGYQHAVSPLGVSPESLFLRGLNIKSRSKRSSGTLYVN